MSDPQRKTKIFVLTISAIVIALIIIGFVLTWKIVQRGQENSTSLYESNYVWMEQEEPLTNMVIKTMHTFD